MSEPSMAIEQTRMLMESAAGTTLPDWHLLAASCQLRQFPKGTQIFAVDEWQPYVYVVRSGMVKLTYLTETGQEWIKSFIGEGDFFACPNVLIAGLKTDYFAVALDDCWIEQLPYAGIRQLAEQYPAWQKAIRQLLETHIVRKEQREKELLTMTPEGRYLSFIASYPLLFQRIQLKEIAHYLGVTPEALSRIRKRLQL